MSEISSGYERFCREYIIDHNATQAYIRCGYSIKSAASSASKLMSRPEIKSRIKELESGVIEDLATRYEITQERILLERARIAFFNIKDIYDDDGNIKNLMDMADDVSAAITDVKFNDTTISSVSTCSKESSLMALEKLHGMYEVDNKQQSPHAHMSDEELNKEIDRMEKKRANKLRKVVRI